MLVQDVVGTLNSHSVATCTAACALEGRSLPRAEPAAAAHQLEEPWSRKDRCDHDGYHETTLPFQQCVPVSACRLPM